MTIVQGFRPAPLFIQQREGQKIIQSEVPKIGPSPGIGGSSPMAPLGPIQQSPEQQDPEYINFSKIKSAYEKYREVVQREGLPGQSKFGKKVAWARLVGCVEYEMRSHSINVSSGGRRYLDPKIFQKRGEQIIGNFKSDPREKDDFQTAVRDVYIRVTANVLSPPNVFVDRKGNIAQSVDASEALTYAASWIYQWAKGDSKKEFEALYSLLVQLNDSKIAQPILAEVVAQCEYTLGHYTVPPEKQYMLKEIRRFIGDRADASAVISTNYEKVNP